MDRELIRKVGVEFLKLSGEDLERFLNKRESSERNLKRGPNVIHLAYYSSLIPINEVEDFEEDLKNSTLELSYFDKSNSPQASLFDTVTAVFISSEISRWIFQNIAWEIISKFLVNCIRNSYINIKRFRSNRSTTKEREAVHSITFNSDKDGVEFVIPADTDPEMAREAFRTMVELAKIHAETKRVSTIPYGNTWHLDKSGVWKRIDHSQSGKDKND